MQIEKFSLFRGLPTDKVDQIKSKLKRYTYKEQEIIFPQVSKAKSLFLLAKGIVQFDSVAVDGRYYVVGATSPGSFFGEVELVLNRAYSTNARALTDVEVWTMNASDFYELYENPAFCQKVAYQLANSLRLQQIMYTTFLHQAPDLRLSMSIIWLYLTMGNPEQGILISQDNLAKLSGLSRQTANKYLMTWQRENLIDVGYNKIHILDLEGLTKVSPLNQDVLKLLF